MTITLSGLYLYPVKSCAAIRLQTSLVDAAGLQDDRRWIVVGEDGQMLTQRRFPRMALIRPALAGDVLTLSYPDVADLTVGRNEGETAPPTMVAVFGSAVTGQVVSETANAWFSAALGTPCKLLKIAEPMTRQPTESIVEHWVDVYAAGEAPRDHAFGFADGFPILVASESSLRALNDRLVGLGENEVDIDRFRPNVVLAGLEAFDEDHVASVEIAGVTLALVAPCRRCSVPDVDPATGVLTTQPGRTLAAFRQFDAGVLFGQNAIVVGGAGGTLTVGDAVEAVYSF